MNASDHELSYPFEGPGAVANGLTGMKNAFMKCLSLHFQLELNTLGLLKVSKRKNLKDWVRANVGVMQLLMLYLSICHEEVLLSTSSIGRLKSAGGLSCINRTLTASRTFPAVVDERLRGNACRYCMSYVVAKHVDLPHHHLQYHPIHLFWTPAGV
jgi:hypothetical protein